MAKNKNLGTVLVDMDGVLADYDKGIRKVIISEYADPLLKDPHWPVDNRHFWPTRKNYHLADDFAIEHRQLIHAITLRPGFYRDLPPNTDAIDGWQRILNLGYMPRVCSAPQYSHPNVIQEKTDWLEEHLARRFGSWVIDTAVLTRQKKKYDGIALIDDNPRLYSDARWVQVLRTQPYNKDVDTEFRLDSWSGQQLPDVLKRARQRYIDLGYLATQAYVE